MLFELTEEQLSILDGYEGVSFDVYSRREKQAVLSDGSAVSCIAYVKADTGYSVGPSSQYLQAVCVMLSERGLGPNEVKVPICAVRQNSVVELGCFELHKGVATARSGQIAWHPEPNTLGHA